MYVKESRICYVDGEASRLFYRGYSIEELTAKSTYEETAYLLIYGALPSKTQLQEFVKRIEDYRPIDSGILQLLQSLPPTCNALDALGCGTLSVFFFDVCEVCYSDVVGEGFEVEFSSLGSSLVAG